MYNLSAFEIRNLFLTKKISAKEIVDYFIKRIEKNNPDINAFLSILKKRAEKQAILLDEKLRRGEKLGKLAGVPIAIKDIINIKDEITTCGSKFLENYKATYNASVIDFLEEEDAILIGKTNLDEFAMGSSTENSAFFSTKNPWDLACVPGGSSGGSAASVAGRLTSLSLGTDTGGSIRQPAAFCGILGFKPTYGRVSRYGMIAFASSFDQIGPFATSAKDIAMVMEVLEKPCKNDSTNFEMPVENHIENLKKDLKGLNIGVPWHFLEDLKSETKKNFLDSIKTLKSLGANIIDIDLDLLKYSIAVYYILAPAEASTNLAKFDGIRYGIRSKEAKTLDDLYELSRDEGFGPEVKRRIMLGTYVLSSGYQSSYYKKSQKVRTLIIRAFEKSFEKCSLIALPTSPSTAFKLESIKSDPMQLYLQDLFTVSANLAGLPGISIPSGFDKENKPFGLQLLGPQLHDSLVISAAHAFESVNNFSKMIPPLFKE